MKFFFPVNRRLDSRRRSAVVVIKSQQRTKMANVGRVPACPVRMGRGSIPTPIELPQIRRILPIKLPFFSCASEVVVDD